MEQKPRGVRSRIAEDLESAYDERIGAFLSEALDARRSVWGTCSHCNRKTEVEVPDWTARTRALQLMLEQGFGSPRQNREAEHTTIIVERHWAIKRDELAACISGDLPELREHQLISKETLRCFEYVRTALLEAGWTAPAEPTSSEQRGLLPPG